MARNKILFEKEYMDDNRWEYRFSGSQRQPTLHEIHDYIVENRLQSEIDDYFMVCAVKGNAAERDDGFQFADEEENKTVILWGYDGSCPICGKERDLSGNKCPVCERPWE